MGVITGDEKAGEKMGATDFNIFRGLVVNDFTFRGVDASDGATFEHTPCGYVVRIGPDAPILMIAEEVQEHRCDVERGLNTTA
jgi:hypothetical protein